MGKHSDATSIHRGSYSGATDPALDPANNVTAHKTWIDTSSGPPYQLKKRNADNDDWEAVGASSGAPADADYVVLTLHGSLSAEVQLGTGVIMTGVAGSRPAASKAGRLYYATDTDTLERDNGSGWDALTLDWGQVTGKPSTFPPAAHDLFSTSHGDVDATDTPADGELLAYRSSGSKWVAEGQYAAIAVVLNEGGTVLTTGVKVDVEVPFACTVERATLLADQAGSIVVDIWKDTYANYPPTDADTITALTPPTITAAAASQDSTLTDWTTALAAGDILRFNIDSCTTITRCTVSLRVRRA